MLVPLLTMRVWNKIREGHKLKQDEESVMDEDEPLLGGGLAGGGPASCGHGARASTVGHAWRVISYTIII